jgi:iron(III) transport system permease protein
MRNRFSYVQVIAVVIAAVVAVPTAFTIYNAVTVDIELWKRLYDTRLGVILPNTLKLLLSVGILTLVIGAASAWLITRHDFAGKKMWEWALILPLAVPGYVLAYAYASIMAPGGPVQEIWIKLFGDASSIPSLYSFWGISIVLGLVNYPYVYLLTRASLLSQNLKYDEAARVLGASRWRRFLRIDIPMAYPGIAAGVALALMEVMADFGTVALLRYPTFTEAVYRQMTARFDPSGAAALAFVLVMMTFLLLNLERHFRGRRVFEQTRGRFAPYIPKRLDGRKTLAATAVILLIVGPAFIAPVSMLIKIGAGAALNGGLDGRLFEFTWNTVLVSSIGATLAAVLALPAAYLHARRGSFLNRIVYYISTLGYSLPGPVIAVGLLLAFSWSAYLQGSILLLLMAYLIRFMPVSLQAEESSISGISGSMEDAARTLGAGIWKRLRMVILPLIKPGLLTGWVVVFVDCMKELPATMMLRPLAFDTLSVRVWVEASESLWEMAALPALLIVIAGLLPLIIITRRMGEGRNDVQIT